MSVNDLMCRCANDLMCRSVSGEEDDPGALGQPRPHARCPGQPRQRLPVRVGQGKGGNRCSGHEAPSRTMTRKLMNDTHH